MRNFFICHNVFKMSLLHRCQKVSICHYVGREGVMKVVCKVIYFLDCSPVLYKNAFKVALISSLIISCKMKIERVFFNNNFKTWLHNNNETDGSEVNRLHCDTKVQGSVLVTAGSTFLTSQHTLCKFWLSIQVADIKEW